MDNRRAERLRSSPMFAEIAGGAEPGQFQPVEYMWYGNALACNREDCACAGSGRGAHLTVTLWNK